MTPTVKAGSHAAAGGAGAQIGKGTETCGSGISGISMSLSLLIGLYESEVCTPRHNHQRLCEVPPQKQHVVVRQPALKLPKAAAVFPGLHFTPAVWDEHIASVPAPSRAAERPPAAGDAGVDVQVDQLTLNALALTRPGHQTCPSSWSGAVGRRRGRDNCASSLWSPGTCRWAARM